MRKKAKAKAKPARKAKAKAKAKAQPARAAKARKAKARSAAARPAARAAGRPAAPAAPAARVAKSPAARQAGRFVIKAVPPRRPRLPPPPPPPPPPRAGPVPLVRRQERVKIEYSSEQQCWVSRFHGMEGIVAGETPCQAAEHTREAVEFAFTILECYGYSIPELTNHPPLLAAIRAFEHDLDKAHDAAHEAVGCFELARQSGKLS